MERTLEATLSRQNMSVFKTLYVEGDIDKQIIENFLENNQIDNIRIYRIEADNEQICYGTYCRDEQLGAKQQIIKFIEQSNNDDTINRNKYLGIVDADLDYCFNEILEIDNLVYTDLNSMESYFVDINLFNKICLDYKINDFRAFENNFIDYLNNFIDFQICFITQVKHKNDFGESMLAFDSIPYREPFIEQNYKFNIQSFKNKVIKNKEKWYVKYSELKENFADLRNNCIDNDKILQFLHGKYLLKYLIYILKTSYPNAKSLKELMIINHLKDKFIISCKYNNFNMFQKIQNFASI